MKRVSGIYSHAIDALAYPLAVLFPADEWVRAAMREKAPAVVGMRAKPASWMGV